MSELLTLSHVSKAFGGVQAIDDFSLSLSEGAIHGLIGPNGAGKTTIFNTITGIYQADAGEIRFDGEDITHTTPHGAAQRGIARTFQNIRLFGNLPVIENVVIACNLYAAYSLPDALLRTPRFRRARRETLERQRNTWRSWACRTAQESAPTACPTAISASWRSPGPWPPIPVCCCWTSPRRA